MLGKKLLTLACAAGIVGLGACFLPPIEPRQPPPPPPRLDFHGMRRIYVSVTNKSASQHTDASALAAAIALAFNDRDNIHGIHASPAESKHHDGTLQIDIVNESALPEATPASPGIGSWVFEVTWNATLTAANGTVLWRATNSVFRSNRPLDVPNSEDVWSNPQSQYRIRYPLSHELITRLLNDE